MREFRKLVFTFSLFFTILVLCGCQKKMITSTYKDDSNNVSVSLTYPQESNCTYSTDAKDLRTNVEEAILMSEKYKIAWDIVDTGFIGDFDEVKKKGLECDGGKEVKYNGIKGVSFYYEPYVRYTVALPINDSCYLELHVYSNVDRQTKETVDEVFNSDEVQNILKTVEIKNMSLK